MIYKNYDIICPKYKESIDLGVELINISTMDKPNNYVIATLCNCSHMLGKVCPDCPLKDLIGLEVSK